MRTFESGALDVLFVVSGLTTLLLNVQQRSSYLVATDIRCLLPSI